MIAAFVNGDLGDGFRMMKDDMSAANCDCENKNKINTMDRK